VSKPKGKKRQPFAAIVADLGSKQPVIGTEPSPQKIPIAAVPPSSNAEAPAWRIGRLELVDPYGWHVLDAAKLDEIRISFPSTKRKHGTTFSSGRSTGTTPCARSISVKTPGVGSRQSTWTMLKSWCRSD
jgi:hypothetical protein